MTNLLDLDNDILQIIGDYVKFDNAYRMEKEKDFEKATECYQKIKDDYSSYASQKVIDKYLTRASNKIAK